MKRRTILQALATAGTLPQLAWAQDKYPSKPITLICPYSAGGNADQRSRQIGRFISTALGQPVLVDDKPGAGGNIGTDAIAKAKPDGYVIGMGNLPRVAWAARITCPVNCSSRSPASRSPMFPTRAALRRPRT
jgi:tripartite-type tricarboxylate transporter receptor subunit TctC